MKTYHCTEDRFLKDIAKHQMIITRNDGVSRHIRFKRPESTCMYFDLITWPGHLCYTGDMGTYVFTRLNDMFEFFRTDREYATKQGKTLYINPSYWAEKCISADRIDGIEQYSEELFKNQVKEWRNRIISEQSGRTDFKQFAKAFIEAVSDDMLCAGESEYSAHEAMRDFNFVDADGKSLFISDSWEYDLRVHSFRFLWCCYAIAWGVEQYDKNKLDREE